MRIGVVADSHDWLPQGLMEGLAGCDEIWHLGDVTTPALLDPFLALDVPLHVVRGNCDFIENWPLVLDLDRYGIRFRLVHIPPIAAPAGVDVLLHGHTHVPRDEMIKSVRFLNPGALGKANKGAPPGYAILTLGPDGGMIWEQHRI